jgi:hypothetical protein
VKIELKTVTLELDGKKGEFVVWGEWRREDRMHGPDYVYALLILKDLYLEMLQAVAVDEVHFFNSLYLCMVSGDAYQFVDDPGRKEEIYRAIGRSQKK